MSEENKTPEGGEEKPPEFKAPTSQEEFDRMVSDRLTRERAKFADYDDLKTKASKYAEIEESKKSELEKAAERERAAIERADKAEQQTLRMTVANSKGLTPGQAKRLVGSTKEELESDADEILTEFGPTKKAAPKPTALKSGSSGEPPRGETGRAAAALRQLRQG